MKNLFTLLILFTTINWLNAQVEFPVLDARWCYDKRGDTNEYLGNFCLTAIDLVEFNGKTYSQLEVTEISVPSTTQFTYGGGMYREENNRFYFIPENETEEKLLYDFNLIQGDTFVATYGFGVIDDSIALEIQIVDTVVTIDGISRKRFQLVNDSIGKSGIWLEGIGNTEWTTFTYPAYAASLSGSDNFTCHSQEGEIVINNVNGGSNFVCDIIINTSEVERNLSFDIYPNPVKDIINIDFNNINVKNFLVVSLTGDVVFEKNINPTQNDLQIPNNLEAGIYFVKVYNNEGLVLTKKFIKI